MLTTVKFIGQGMAGLSNFKGIKNLSISKEILDQNCQIGLGQQSFSS